MTRAYTNAADGRYQQGGRRNLIINGAMEVAQRGTSFTASGYTLDRFDLNLSGGSATVTQETLTPGQTDIPSQFINYLRLAVTTGNDYLGIRYKVENVQAVGEGEVTLSFYAKGTNPGGGSVYVQMNQSFGSGGSSDVTLTQQTVQLTSSWQRFTLTFDLPSISGKTVDNSDSNVRFQIFQYTDASTDAWTLDITGVQLEYGNVATPFEHRSFGEELALCQRYYFKHTVSQANDSFCVGMMEAPANSCFGDVKFAVPMRSDPTALETTGTATDYEIRVPGATVVCNAIPTIIRASVYSSLVKFAISSTETSNTGQMRAATTNGYLAWSAEL